METPDPILSFAQRLHRRDHPEPEPLRFDRESVLTRLQAGVAAASLMRYARGHRSVAELLYAFVGQPEWSTATLADELGRVGTWVTRVMRALTAAGYAGRHRWPQDTRTWHYRLTRAGEDW